MKFLAFDIGIKNLSYCLIEYDIITKKYEIVDWNVLDISNGKKKNNIYDTTDNILNQLDNIFDVATPHVDNIFDVSTQNVATNNNQNKFQDVDEIIIENQPCMKNPIMKSIQIIIFTYFNIKKKNEQKIKKVRLVSPRTKCNCYDGPDDLFDFSHIKSKYTQRKKKAVECCRYMIKNNQTLLEFFNSYKKKDDLADSYLLCLTYIKKYYP